MDNGLSFSSRIVFTSQYSNRGHQCDTRDRRDRTLQRVAAWTVQIEHLTDAYLHWKSGGPAPRFPADVEMSWEIHSIDLFSMYSLLV